MADIVKDATDYRIKQIEIAEEKYYKTLIATLDRIEREVVELANRDLKKTTDGRLIELQAAIAIRPKIKAILDKEYLLKKITKLDQRDTGDDFINFNFVENENEINLFFDKKTFNLIGWQTVDIYQNVSITYLSSIKRNQKLDKEIFKLPKQN